MSSLKLANLWRVISDVDLERIRASARMPFELLVIAEDDAVGQRVRAGLGAVAGGAVHPYVVAVDPENARQRPTTPLIAVLASATPDLSVRMKAADEHCIRDSVPRITLILGTDAPEAGARRVAEQARIAVVDVMNAPRPLLSAIVGLVEGDARLALAAALPVFRQVVADTVVDETAKANASFAVTTGLAETIPVLTAPLNLGDMVILTKNQLIMGYKISLAAGRDDDPRSMLTEILGVIGGGFMFRQVARQLVGLIPIAGLVPKVAIAYAGTYAMGRGLTAWAIGGTEVTADSLSRYTAEGLDKGRVLAQQLIGQVRAGVPSPARSWQRLRGWLPVRQSRPRQRRNAKP
ncbi:putative protein/domain associated with GTPases [Luteitalea pratensis]|uniref:DUF697 domain-containing protein n=1 Tax=Luteitalea pratensis TaxID=1855912 RepID=A0A143PQ52_LUTPR|nr:hypothetical protein [Luteitalea pratensis]AMY10742.1 putative protein/domain associated with GTPases [Luteitalea pratensis]